MKQFVKITKGDVTKYFAMNCQNSRFEYRAMKKAQRLTALFYPKYSVHTVWHSFMAFSKSSDYLTSKEAQNCATLIAK